MFARHRTHVITAIKPEPTREQTRPRRNPLRFARKGHGAE
jgi:hypothetical protein